VVSRDVVLADIRQQVAAGATHVTFGDPDFFNGPAHAAKIVEPCTPNSRRSRTTRPSRSSTCCNSGRFFRC